MRRRVGLILDQQQSIYGLLQASDFSEWEFQRASTVQAASRILSEQNCLVGIAVFHSQTDFPLREIESLLASCEAEWMALLPSTLLMSPSFGAFILHNFHDYHTLPVDQFRLRVTLGHAHGKAQMRQGLKQNLGEAGRFGMIGRSPAMLELYRQIEKVLQVNLPVLLHGESGTGKELAARAIHQHSSRAGAPFIAMNCGALPPNLIHSELFGHEKGAFTGAHLRKIGSIEAANGGILFLDEIGDLPLELQANLLRFLQEKTISRVGSTRPIPVDVRVVAATHVDLKQSVAAGRFREDLYYRLNVLQITVPPLRDRPGDIALLADAVFRDYSFQKSPQVRGFSAEALEAMNRYRWPGNIRELINRVQQAMIMTENRLITARDLGFAGSDGQQGLLTLEDARATIEKRIIEDSLRRNRNNVSQAARQLGVSRVTLYRLMNRLNIVL